MKERNFTIIRTRSREEIVLEVQKARETIAALSKQQDAVVRYINDLVRALQPEIVLFPKRPPSDLRLIKPAAEIEESGKEGLEDQECESCGCSRKQPVDLNAVHNSVTAGSIALADSEFAYVTLSETNNAVITVSKATIGAGSASGFMAYNILVLGYRNAADDNFYPEELAGVFAQMIAGAAFVEKTAFNAHTILYAVSDNTPAALTVDEQRIIGRKAGGNIAALTGADVLGITQALDGRQQAIICADNVTVDWSAGGTQYMTFDRDTVTMSFSNPTAGGVYRLLLQQSSGGSDSITWSTTIKWRGGSAPTLTATGNAVDILTFTYINSVWYGDFAQNFA